MKARNGFSFYRQSVILFTKCTNWNVNHFICDKCFLLLLKLLDCVERNDYREVAEVIVIVAQVVEMASTVCRKSKGFVDYAYVDQMLSHAD